MILGYMRMLTEMWAFIFSGVSMKFKLEILAKYYEEHPSIQRFSCPPVSADYKKLYTKKPKLTLKERWYLFWSQRNVSH